MTQPPGPVEHLLRAEYIRQQFTWQDLVYFLRQYRWVILFVFITTVLSTYMALSLYSDKYETVAKLLVKVGRETVDPPATASARGGTLITSGVRKEEVNSDVQILTSQDIAEQVVREIGVSRFQPGGVPPEGFFARLKFELKKVARAIKGQYEEAMIALGLQRRLDARGKAVAGLLRDVTVTPERESDVISVALKSADPRLGEDVLKKWISIYLVRRVEIRENRGVREFLGGEEGRALARLTKAEAARNAWKREHQLSLTPMQKQMLIQQLRDHSEEQDRTLAEINALSGQLEEGRRLFAKTPVKLTTSEVETVNPPMLLYRNDLAALEVERAKLLNKYEAQAEPVRLMDGQIVRLRELILKEDAKQISAATREPNPLARSLELKLQEDSIHLHGLRERSRAQSEQKRLIETELGDVESADATLAGLERERQVSEDLYLAMVKRENEAYVTSELDRSRLSNVSVLAWPSSSLLPVSPKRELIMGIALILGLMIGIGVPLVYELLSGKVRTPEDLARLTNLPYLGSVPLKGEAAT